MTAKPGPSTATRSSEREPKKVAIRARDPEATRASILRAAKVEFARGGFGGARVDTIAARAKANKRMIYHYFGSKEALFTAVLEQAYSDIRAAERELPLDQLDPASAIEQLIKFTWNYYLKNPEFLLLVNSANLHKARHLKKSPKFKEMHRNFVADLATILERGAATGVFRNGIDPVQLHLTAAAVGYYYLTNRHTGSVIFDRDLMTPAALEARIAFNVETILRSICADGQYARLRERTPSSKH